MVQNFFFASFTYFQSYFTQFKSLDLIKAFVHYSDCSVRIKKYVLDTYNFITAELYFFHCKFLFNLFTHVTKILFAFSPKLDQNSQKWLSKCLSLCILRLVTRNKMLTKTFKILKRKVGYETYKEMNGFLNVKY